jgi:16S rRNA (adenine1518-N6/adenine1519-N6)-dimethyltransferase
MARRLGQHFLYDPKIAARIAEAADVGPDDTVLEIGPGKGILTAELAKRAKRVVAVEKDKTLAKALEGKFNNVSIIAGDALDINWPDHDKNVSNLPFNISSPILERVFECGRPAVLMVQKEFAARLLAKPGTKDYSRLTVACNYHCTAQKIGELRPGAFRPAPKVSATIVKLTPHAPPFTADRRFWETVNTLFQHRRKIVRAALKGKSADLPEELAKKRVFTLTLQDLKEIADASR